MTASRRSSWALAGSVGSSADVDRSGFAPRHCADPVTTTREHREHSPHQSLGLHANRVSVGSVRAKKAAATGSKAVSDAAKSTQTLLGDHQDSVVSRSHLTQQADAAHGVGEDTLTYGVRYQREADLAEQCRAQLPEALKALDKAVRKET